MNFYKLPDNSTVSEAVILANGKYPVHPIPVSALKNTGYLVCCDGAVSQLENTIQPSAIVGDCDSLQSIYRERYKDIIFTDPDQETNDLTKAVNFCVKKGYKDIIILGATGKREDHTLGNISLLAEYIDIVCNIHILTDHGVFTAIKEPAVFESFAGQQISLFSVENCPLTVQNLKYPVNERIFTNWWQGSLNESLGNEFYIITTGKLLVYRAF